MTYKISIEEFEEPIEMPKRYMVCTKELTDFEPHVALETNDIDAAQTEANVQLDVVENADIVWIFDTHEQCGVSIRKPKRLVMRRAQLQGHSVIAVEVAS